MVPVGQRAHLPDVRDLVGVRRRPRRRRVQRLVEDDGQRVCLPGSRRIELARDVDDDGVEGRLAASNDLSVELDRGDGVDALEDELCGRGGRNRGRGLEGREREGPRRVGGPAEVELAEAERGVFFFVVVQGEIFRVRGERERKGWWWWWGGGGVGGGAGSASRRGSEEVGVVEEREKKGRASSIGLPG